MDNFVTPPTDNIYKFLGLSGLAICVLIPLYSIKNAIDIEREGAAHNEEVAAWRAEYDWESATEAATSQPTSRPTIIADFHGSRSEYVTAERLKAHKKSIESRASSLKTWTWLGLIGSAVGSFLMWVGLPKWWRLQRMQDELLEIELANARATAPKADAPPAPMAAERSDV